MDGDDDESEAHEVYAAYDNLAALTVGEGPGWPVIGCSCGFRACAETFEEAGALFDEHVEEIRDAG